MDWSSAIASLVRLLHAHYLDPEVAAQVAGRLRQRLAAGEYARCADEAELAEAVTADAVAASGDLHLRLRYSVAPLPPGEVVPDSGRHPEEARLDGHGFARVERLAGNVGLVDLRRFFPVSMSRHAAAAAMQLVAGADALLVDLRRCAGGEPAMVAFVASYLLDGRTPLSTLVFPASGELIEWWTDPAVPGPRYGGAKPLWLLVGPETFSAGEGFASDLSQHGRATLVGETTAGAAYFDYRYRVSEHLMFSVPSGYPEGPVRGGHWERTGVPPDRAVPAAAALAVAYRQALGHVVSLGGAGHRAGVHAEAVAALAAG